MQFIVVQPSVWDTLCIGRSSVLGMLEESCIDSEEELSTTDGLHCAFTGLSRTEMVFGRSAGFWRSGYTVIHIQVTCLSVERKVGEMMFSFHSPAFSLNL